MRTRLCGLLGAAVILVSASDHSWAQNWLIQIDDLVTDPATAAISECFETEPAPAHCRALLADDLDGGAPGPLLLHCLWTDPTPAYCGGVPGFDRPADDGAVTIAPGPGPGRVILASCFWTDPMPAYCYEMLGLDPPVDERFTWFPGGRFDPLVPSGPGLDRSCWWTDPTPPRCLPKGDQALILTPEAMALQSALQEELGIPAWCFWTDPMPWECVLMMTRENDEAPGLPVRAPVVDEVIPDWQHCFWTDPPPPGCPGATEPTLNWECFLTPADPCAPGGDEWRIPWVPDRELVAVENRLAGTGFDPLTAAGQAVLRWVGGRVLEEIFEPPAGPREQYWRERQNEIARDAAEVWRQHLDLMKSGRETFETTDRFHALGAEYRQAMEEAAANEQRARNEELNEVPGATLADGELTPAEREAARIQAFDRRYGQVTDGADLFGNDHGRFGDDREYHLLPERLDGQPVNDDPGYGLGVDNTFPPPDFAPGDSAPPGGGAGGAPPDA